MIIDAELQDDLGRWSVAVVRSLRELGEVCERLDEAVADLRERAQVSRHDLQTVRDLVDAMQADAADDRRAIENVASDVRRIVERVETLEARIAEDSA